MRVISIYRPAGGHQPPTQKMMEQFIELTHHTDVRVEDGAT